MKKQMFCGVLIALLLSMMLPFAGVQAAESQTFDQQQEGYLAILQAMWETDEWEVVRVPVGIYEVGVEIPAGEWILNSETEPLISYGPDLNSTKTKIDKDTRIRQKYLKDEKYPDGMSVCLDQGMYIYVGDFVSFTKATDDQEVVFPDRKEDGENKTLAQLQEAYLAMPEAMMESDEWEEVDVEAGVYQVGVDMPEGEWTIKSEKEPLISIGPELDSTKTKIDEDTRIRQKYLKNDVYLYGMTVELHEGIYIYIESQVSFTVPIRGIGFRFE